LPSPRASKNERGILRRLLPVAITICLGVGVSVAAFVTVQTWEHTQVRATFESAAHDQATVLGHIIQRDLLMLKLLERFYAGSEKVERDEFHEFTKSIPEDIQCVQALEWVPRVRDAERAAYEEEGCREGLTGFQITERDADGRMVRAGPREEYFPVHFAEPLTGNEQALGFDLGSEPTRRAALEAARDSGEMRGTGRIRLVQETGDQWGILVLVPVYRNGASPETVEARRANLAGFVLGVFRLGDLVDHAIAQLGPRGIDVALYDASSPAGRRLLAWRGSRMRNEPAPAPPDADLPTLREMHHVATLHPAGRTWVIVCTPCPEFLATAKEANSWTLLVGGLAFTALLAAYFSMTGRRAAEVERLAGRLLESNEKLEADVRARKRAEEALREREENLSITLHSIGDAVIATDTAGRVARMNPVAEQLTGWPLAEAVGKPLAEIFRIINARTREPASDPLAKALATGEVVVLTNDTALIARDGAERQIADSAAPIRDVQGRIRGAVLVFHDVTAAYELKKALRERVKELTCFERVRNGLQEGLSVEQICQNTAESLVQGMGYPEIAVAVITLGDQQFSAGRSAEGLTHSLHADIEVAGSARGQLSAFYVEDRPFLLPYEQNLVNGVATILSHWLERECAEEALRESEAKYRTLAENIPQKVFVKGRDLRYVSMNENYARDLGIRPAEAVGKVDYDFFPKELADKYRADDRGIMETGRTDELDEKYIQGGKEVWVHTVKTPVRDRTGEIVGVSGIFWDITERKRAEQAVEEANRRLEELATTDALTGLANRRKFLEVLETEFRRSRRYGGRLTLAMVDVDHFKVFNDTYGHAFGDRVLVEVAKHLGAEARQTDVVARLGGDEFVILMPETSVDKAAQAAERIRKTISKDPISDGTRSVPATISVGIATVEASQVATPEIPLKQADNAMYAAKEAGRNCVRVAGPKTACQTP